MEGIEDTNPTHTPNNPGYGGGLPQQQLAPNPVYVSRQQPTPEALDLMHMGFQMLRHEWPWIKDEDWRATGTVYFTGRDPDTRLTFKVKVRYEGVLRKKPVLYWALFTLQAPWMPQATIGWDAASSEEGECEKGFTLIPTNNQLAPIANVSGVCVWSRLKEALEPNPEVAYGFNTFRQLPHMKDLDLAWFLLPLSSSGTFGWGAAVEWNTSRLSLIIKVPDATEVLMHYSHYVDETRKRRELKQPDPVFWAACDVHPATVRAWDDTERDAWYRRYAACLEWSFMLDYCVVIREYKGLHGPVVMCDAIRSYMTAIVSTDNPNELSGKLSGATRWGLTGSGFDDSGRRHKRAVESRLPAFAFEMPTEEEERIAFEADRILQQEDKDGDVEMKMGYRQDPFPEEEMEGSDDDDDMMDDMENDMDPRSQTF